MPSTIPVVIHVRGEVIYRHASEADTAPTIAGYRYTAVLADRSEVILRRTTDRYEWAYQWTVPIARGKARGLGAHFTFSRYRIGPSGALAELRIEWL